MKYATVLIAAILLIGGCRSALTVTRVLSADTIVLSDGSQVRYAGLTSPASTSPWHQFCREANAYLVQDKPVKITVEPAISKPDHLVGYVYTPVIVGKQTKYLFVNAELIRYGFALARPVPEQCRHPKLWRSLWQLQETEVRSQRRGIWSGKTPEQYYKKRNVWPQNQKKQPINPQENGDGKP